MSKLDKLKSVSDLSSLAKLLGFTPKGLAYILYKIDDSKKYRTFDIPKKNGGTRTIEAPIDQLALLQSRLGDFLYKCVAELQKESPRLWHASHGFYRGRTIVSNAERHRKKRYVFNVDISDFFGTINFGRVRGFFIKDRSFELGASVATIVAQIACRGNALPQGSPCSPVISNLIGNILDVRLLALARDARCIYTRYADDLTFSTNELLFPSEVAKETVGGVWLPGERLISEIKRSGFELNPSKTRMSLRRSRQCVTGLVVNEKVNISQAYYRNARAMCHALFSRGYYYRPSNTAELIDDLDPLEGILSHIYFVKARRDRSYEQNKAADFHAPKASNDLYKRFLFFKHFVALKRPLILTEGISDITYLKCAIKSLAASFPALAETAGGKVITLVKFLTPSNTAKSVMNLAHGTSGQVNLISEYSNRLKKFLYKPVKYPVIIVCDNDRGAKEVFAKAKVKYGKLIDSTTTDIFYYLGDNLYLIKVPEAASAATRDIEDLFPSTWLNVRLNGKSFDKRSEKDDATTYGKVAFAEKVVRPNADKIDFNQFSDLLSRMDACIAHYKTISVSVPATTTVPTSAGAA